MKATDRVTSELGKIGRAIGVTDYSPAALGLKPASSGQQINSERISLIWQLRRWTPRHIWYRVRLPFRRRRWLHENFAATRAYVKSSNAVAGRGPTLVLGDFSGNYGLARGAQYDLPYIRERCPDVEAVDIAPLLTGKSPQLNIDRLRQYGGVVLLCQPDTYAKVLSSFAPEQIAGAWRVGRWVWETPVFPSAWRFALDLVHEIWTPSQFCADAFRTGTDLPIEVVPHQVRVDPNAPLTLTRADLGIPEDAFMGLSIMDLQSCPERKNPWAHIRAWNLAFGDDPKAILAMKLRVGKRTKNILRELKEMVHSKIIFFCTDDLSNSQINSLAANADVLLSLHRSEGFGLTLHEGLAFGKNVVATNWSATTDIEVNSNYFNGVPFTLIPYDDWLNHYDERNFEWASADIIYTANKLKQLRDTLRVRDM